MTREASRGDVQAAAELFNAEQAKLREEAKTAKKNEKAVEAEPGSKPLDWKTFIDATTAGTAKTISNERDNRLRRKVEGADNFHQVTKEQLQVEATPGAGGIKKRKEHVIRIPRSTEPVEINPENTGIYITRDKVGTQKGMGHMTYNEKDLRTEDDLPEGEIIGEIGNEDRNRGLSKAA